MRTLLRAVLIFAYLVDTYYFPDIIVPATYKGFSLFRVHFHDVYFFEQRFSKLLSLLRNSSSFYRPSQESIMYAIILVTRIHCNTVQSEYYYNNQRFDIHPTI